MKTSRIRPIVALLLLIISSLTASAEHTVLFIGFFDQSHPALSSDFENKLREQLAVSQNIKLIDYIETQRYRNMVEFDRYPSLSQKLFANLDRYITDSSLILSGKIDKLSFTTVKKGLFRTAVEGELLISFTIFNLHQKRFAYSITIHGRSSRKKGRVFFGNIENVTTLSAAERHRMIDEMTTDAIRKSASTLDALVRSIQLKLPAPQNTKDAEVNNQPSISDVFTVPSVEAAKIDDESPDKTKSEDFTEDTITEKPENKPDN